MIFFSLVVGYGLLLELLLNSTTILKERALILFLFLLFATLMLYPTYRLFSLHLVFVCNIFSFLLGHEFAEQEKKPEPPKPTPSLEEDLLQ